MYYHNGEVKPIWRGRMHAVSLSLFVIYGEVLLVWASTRTEDTERRIAATVLFVGSTLLCFAISADFHLYPFESPASEDLARRADHIGVVLLCFGNAIPVALLVYTHTAMVVFLVLSAVFTALAVLYSCVKKLEPQPTDRLASTLYCLLVATQFIFAYQVWDAVPHWVFALWLTSYVIEGLGALCYQLGLGDSELWYCCCPPAVFGSHELFHLATVVGQLLLCTVHFYLIAIRG